MFTFSLQVTRCIYNASIREEDTLIGYAFQHHFSIQFLLRVGVELNAAFRCYYTQYWTPLLFPIFCISLILPDIGLVKAIHFV